MGQIERMKEVSAYLVLIQKKKEKAKDHFEARV
jgi:hypothetical protein